MSGRAFGAVRTGAPTGACPCGSLLAYAACCGPLLAGECRAETAEALMRSRYTAYAVADEAYLLRTWHPRTRPERVGLDPGARWTGLDVVHTERETLHLSAPDRMNAAGFLIKTAGHVLAERPRLEREGRWGALLAAVAGLVSERNVGTDGANVSLPCEYLLLEATPRRPA